MKNVSRGVKILSLAFLFIFFGYNGVQQYLTIYFSEANLFKVGFYSLILIYLFYTLAKPLAAIFVSKYGSKKSLLLSSLFYSIFILSLLTKSVPLIYIASILLGIAAAFLWMAQNVYLIRASKENSYGENSGFFATFLSLGSGLGILVLAFLIAKFSYQIPFFLFSIFPLFGFLLFFKLEDIKMEQKFSRLGLLKKVFLSPTALKFSSLWFAWSFIFGLVIGIIPIQIKDNLGISFVGVLTSLFFILPTFFSYFFGKVSDLKGRKPMIFFSYLLLLLGLLLIASEKSIFLLLGVLLLALKSAIGRPIITALIADVSTKENLEFLTGLFWMLGNTGVIFALLISSQFSIKMIYLISISITIISFLIILPLLKLEFKEIKEKIAKETGQDIK